MEADDEDFDPEGGNVADEAEKVRLITVHTQLYITPAARRWLLREPQSRDSRGKASLPPGLCWPHCCSCRACVVKAASCLAITAVVRPER